MYFLFKGGNILFTDYVLAKPELELANLDSYISYIAMCLGIINAALPMSYINKKIFSVNPVLPNL